EGTSGQLKASIGAGALHVRLLDPDQRPEAERILAQALTVPIQLDADPVALSARIVAAQSGANPAGERVAHALADLSRAGVIVTDFALGQPSLDEVFLALTGHSTTNNTTAEEKAS
ncbi:MAG TPA: hypothetical protein VF739_09985, partial [Ktedonobacterales bacterium]